MMIGSNVNGVSGFIFNDLLSSFEVNDCDGEETKNIPLLKAQFINDDDRSTIRFSCIDEEQLKLGLGDTVEIFCDVSESISDSIVLEVNKVDTTKTVVAHAKGSDISDATIEMINSGKALARKAKKSKIIDYKSLREQLVKPTFMSCNGCLSNKQDRALNLCLLAAFKAIDKYDFSHSTCSDTDVDKFKEKIIEELKLLGVENPNQSVKTGGVGEDTVTKVTRGFLKVLTASTSARCYSTVSVIGSLVSQETIKVLTRVHTPIEQLLLFESLDSIVYDENKENGINVDLDMFNSINVYGRELARELAHMKVFVVGSGAIGCELLKTFALMGIGIGDGKETDANSDKNLWTGLSKGGIVLTDMDHIEVLL
jgi:ubiquitin-activating enzyme E1